MVVFGDLIDDLFFDCLYFVADAGGDGGDFLFLLLHPGSEGAHILIDGHHDPAL